LRAFTLESLSANAQLEARVALNASLSKLLLGITPTVVRECSTRRRLLQTVWSWHVPQG
jgi:hypothetical protein